VTANPSIDPALFLHEQLAQASPDLMRELLGTFIKALLSAQADSVCGADCGTRSPDRRNSRNGYRHRDRDTRAGTIDVGVPKLREGAFFPDWLLERHRRAEAALTTVVATWYLLGVSTRGMDKLVRTLGITGLSKSQVSGCVDDEGSRGRPGREGRGDGATGVNADGYREVLGIHTATTESAAGWLGFFRDVTARGLRGGRWLPRMGTPGWSRRSGPRCRTRPGSGAAPTTPPTS